MIGTKRHVQPLRRPIRWVVGVLALAIGLVATSVASAHSPNPVFTGGRFNQNQALPYSWRPGAVPAWGYQVAINAAAADASSTRGSRAATFSYAAGAANLIGYGISATCGPQGIACFTRNAPTGFTMWMREHGHVFDWGSLRWCQHYSTWPDGCYDVENIMLDEFGHVEILNHHANYYGDSDYTDAVVQTVSRAKPLSGWNAHAFGRCDVASLQVQYDMQSWGAKYSTCLDLTTTMTLAASPASLAASGTVTLTATLKVADNPAYLRLALNPVALRLVTLQSRAPGGSWTTVGAMPYGSPSGTYARAVRLTSRTEFRAVFATPTDEGLRGTTSPIVTVAVGL